VGLQKGLCCDVRLEIQGVSSTLRHYHQAIRHLCMLGMVVWLSDGQCQEETKQNPNISMLRDSRIYAHHSHQCCGSTYLPPLLELVVQSKVRSAAHGLWSLGCWSYLPPNRGHSSIPMRLQQADPIFNIGVDVMRSAFNLEPKHRVTMLTREDWTKPALLMQSKGSSGLQICPR
jgi:hypothetical protein